MIAEENPQSVQVLIVDNSRYRQRNDQLADQDPCVYLFKAVSILD